MLSNADIESPSSTGQHLSTFRNSRDELLEFKPSIGTGKRGNLSDFGRGTIAGAISTFADDQKSFAPFVTEQQCCEGVCVCEFIISSARSLKSAPINQKRAAVSLAAVQLCKLSFRR